MHYFFTFMLCAMRTIFFVREYPLLREDLLSVNYEFFIHIMVLL